MSWSADGFEAALFEDVRRIFKDGLPLQTSAASMAALAEMAEAVSTTKNDGKAGYYSAVIAAALCLAIDRFDDETRRDGLTAFFGFDADPGETMEQRLAKACPMLAYKVNGGTYRNGPSLGRVKRKVGTEYRLVTDIIIDDVTQQLVALAAEHGFVYSGRFATVDGDQASTAPVGEVRTPTQPSMDIDAMVSKHPLSTAFFAELQKLASEGFEATAASNSLPTLAALAQDNGSLEEMLTWAIEQASDDHNWRQGTRHFLGLGDIRGLPLPRRREQAAGYFGYPDAFTFSYGFQEKRILLALRAQLVVLASNGVAN